MTVKLKLAHISELLESLEKTAAKIKELTVAIYKELDT